MPPQRDNQQTRMVEVTATLQGIVFPRQNFSYSVRRGRGAKLEVDAPPANGDSLFKIAKFKQVGGNPLPQLPHIFSALGEWSEDEIEPLLEYRLYGRIDKSTHAANKGKSQLRLDSWRLASPHGRAGTVRYLQQCDGIGHVTAQTLWDKFKGDAVKILREKPEVAAAAVPRLNEGTALAASEKLQHLQVLETVTIDVIDLLDRRGFPRKTPQTAIQVWGAAAPAIIGHDPYRLMSLPLKGIGFRKCDSMYLDLGLPAGRRKRQAYCLTYAVASDRDGHVWLPLSKAMHGLDAQIGGAEVNGTKALSLAKRAKLLTTRGECDWCGGADPDCPACDGEATVWVAEHAKAEAEHRAAEMLAAKMAEEAKWPEISGLAFTSLTDHQREKLTAATSGAVGILGGSPGTGKTFSLAALSKELIRHHEQANIAVCAPTGKAAVRCTEALQQHGVPLRAKTIHSTLGVESSEGGWTFKHNATNPLPFDWLVVDEFSMTDLLLWRSLLSACPRGMNILLVGDVNQLPPVGCGAPLRDMIAAGMPHGELTEIHRNAGSIVRVCAAIRDNKPWQPDAVLRPNDTPPANLKLIPATRKTAPRKLLDLMQKLNDRPDVDAIEDVQVLVAVNKKSELSRVSLNRQLQQLLNPAGQQIKESPFRVGDKVIQLKNGFLPSTDNPDEKLYVANGDMGRVLEIHPKKTIVQFANPERKVLVPRGLQNGNGNGDDDADDDEKTNTGCDLDLAYSITVHKAQGSSARIVVVCADEYPGASGPHGVMSREHIYTAISRAEQICFILGQMTTVKSVCRKRAIGVRKTFLVDGIAAARKALEAK